MHRGAAIAATLIAVQAALITWIGSSALAQRALRIGIGAAVFLLVLLLYRFADNGALVTIAVPHAMAYLTLLVVFAVSLRPGREAVATLLARKARGPLSDKTLRYTRRVTWAWCWFFVAQLTGSLLLLLFAPRMSCRCSSTCATYRWLAPCCARNTSTDSGVIPHIHRSVWPTCSGVFARLGQCRSVGDRYGGP